MSEMVLISKAKTIELTKLKQKKYRQQTQRVVLEGRRLLQQLAAYGVLPLELYSADALELELPETVPVYQIRSSDLKRICDSDSPAGIAALYSTPTERRQSFTSALYLDGISDPGNMGTIFRLAAAFEIRQIFLSENCCEISNSKVIRSSLGAVYHIAHQTLSHEQLLSLPAELVYLDMDASHSLREHRPPPNPTIYILGSEAHGVSRELKQGSKQNLRIEMNRDMESLNVAISAGILCHHLYTEH